jgi:PAS domain S-box-containing protein
LRNTRRLGSPKRAGRSAARRGRALRVTRHKKVEEALRESEERFRSFVEKSSDGIVLIDERGYIVEWSEGQEKLTGLSRAHALGQAIWDVQFLFLPDERKTPEVHENLKSETLSVLRTGRSSMQGKESQVEIQRVDGTRRLIQTAVFPIKTSSGWIVGSISRDITERRRAEEASSRLAAIVESSDDAIVGKTLDGVITSWNKGAEKLYGYSAEEANGKPISILIPSNLPDELPQILGRLKRGERVQHYETERVRKDGKIIDISLAVSAIRDSTGRLVGASTIARDITERKRAEEALKESEAKYRTLVEQSLQGILIAQGPPPRLVFANLAMAKILGYTPGELTSLSPKETEGLIHPEDRVMFFARFSDRLQGKPAPPRYEIRAIRKDGQVCWLDFSPNRIEYRGQPAVQATFVDITERKRVEEALRESEQKLRAVVHGSPIPQFVIDRNHKIVYWNEALEQITGIKAEQVVGTSRQWSAFYSEERPCMADLLVDGRTERISELYAGKYAKSTLIADAYEATDYFSRMGKEGKWLYFTAAIIRDAEGNVIGAVETLEDITERKRAEEKLRGSEERYRSLYENSTDAILLTATDGRIFSANPEACRMLQRSEAEICQIGRNGVVDLNDPRLPLALQERARTGRFRGELNLKRKDGTVFPAEISTNVFKAADEPEATSMIIRDITERRKMQAELEKYTKHLEELVEERTRRLREGEERTRAILNATTAILVVIDRFGMVVDANRAFCEALRVSPESVVGKNLFELLAEPDVLAGRRDSIDKVFLSGRPVRVEDKRHERWFDTIIYPIRGADGSVVAVAVSASDITERKQMEDALRISERRFRDLADLLPQIVFEIDNHGEVQFMNRAAFAATGCAEEDFRKGLNAFQMFAPEEHDRAVQGIQRTLSGETIGGREFTALRRDGTTFPVIVYTAPIVREGKSVGVRGIAIDITESKRLEAQLVESERLAAVGEAAAMVGHDLRNPLQAMTSTIYVAKGLATSENVEDRKRTMELLGTLDDEIQYMDKIVSDLQDYARRVGAELVETSLPDLIRATVSNVRIPRNVEVAVNVGDGLSNVKLDPLLFRRVLTNLILNAVQAMPEGGKLTITGSRGDESFTVTVQDTGVGIAPENLERVFTPFFTTKAKGQGLGLAVCKRLVEAQGGTITVESKPDHGSTFTVTIPATGKSGSSQIGETDPDHR